MKVVISEPCGGLCPDHKTPFAFEASEFPVEVGERLGKELLKNKYARKHTERRGKKTDETDA